MTHILDTVVLSELHKPRPNPRVSAWVDTQNWEDLYISTMTVGEIHAGIELARTEAQRRQLVDWWKQISEELADRILPIGASEAATWGRIHARLSSAGAMPAFVDSLIAATALAHSMTVVTRNLRHFRDFGVPVLNPWEAT